MFMRLSWLAMRTIAKKYGRTCKKCNNAFWARHPQYLICKECRPKDWKSKAMYPLTTRFSTGSILELRVCIDLMAKGYEVYRAMSACAPFDLIVWTEDELRLVEVKSAYDRGGSKLWVPNGIHAYPGTILAAVAIDRIEYHPELPGISTGHK